MGFPLQKIKQAAIFGIIIFLVFIVIKQLGSAYQNTAQVKDFEERISKLNEENEQVKNTTDSFKDPYTIDREARTRLNLKKEGEHVVMIIPSGKENYQDQFTIATVESQGETVFDRIRSWLGF